MHLWTIEKDLEKQKKNKKKKFQKKETFPIKIQEYLYFCMFYYKLFIQFTILITVWNVCDRVNDSIFYETNKQPTKNAS